MPWRGRRRSSAIASISSGSQSRPSSARESTRIIVELPGLQDVERAKNLIGQTALLEFQLVEPVEDRNRLLQRISGLLAAGSQDSAAAASDAEPEVEGEAAALGDSAAGKEPVKPVRNRGRGCRGAVRGAGGGSFGDPRAVVAPAGPWRRRRRPGRGRPRGQGPPRRPPRRSPHPRGRRVPVQQQVRGGPGAAVPETVPGTQETGDDRQHDRGCPGPDQSTDREPGAAGRHLVDDGRGRPPFPSDHRRPHRGAARHRPRQRRVHGRRTW